MKRQRELARAEKRRDKAARRAIHTGSRGGHDTPADAGEDYDPDIAHIVPGPQPIPWADEFDDEEDASDDGDDQDDDR